MGLYFKFFNEDFVSVVILREKQYKKMVTININNQFLKSSKNFQSDLVFFEYLCFSLNFLEPNSLLL